MIRYIMSITAQDRAGIVAGVSEALVELGGNVEAASQTVHQGYFAMIILCAFDGTVDVEEMSGRVRGHAGDDLHVYITEHKARPVEASGGEQSFIITSIGPDKPGILHALTSYLASKKINIDDLYSCVENGEFVVICQVSVPEALDVSMLQMDLETVGQERGFTASMQHENIFVATNELRTRGLR